MKKQHVVIMRGISGSGKSRYREEHYADSLVASADDFWSIGGDKEYAFDPLKIGLAHSWCLQKFLGYLQRNTFPMVPYIVVDNTNTRAVEIAPYYALAESMKRTVEVITIWADPEDAIARNVHNVPADTISEQFKTLLEEGSRMPPWWKHKIWCSSDFHQKMQERLENK